MQIITQWRKLRLEEPFGPFGLMRAHGCQSGIFVVRVGMGSCFQCVMTYDDAAISWTFSCIPCHDRRIVLSWPCT
mgnify:CR=1 FL=1